MATQPSSFGRYTVTGVLGEGGFATVYRGWDAALNREVAIKALLPHLARDADVHRRFIAEAQTLARLHHPNVVQVHDVGDEDGRPYFAMELLQGRTLAEALRAGRPNTDQVLGVVRGLAAALDELHRAGLVHRDVKPTNIMLEPGGRTVLMDLGIARWLLQTQYTQVGSSLGTPAYMSPEQVLGRSVTPAADIYSLGILTYHMLVGRPPFEGDTAYLLHAQVYEQPPELQRLRQDLPAVMYAAVDAAMAKEPSQRPASAGLFSALLAGQTRLDSPSRGYVAPNRTALDPTLISPINGTATPNAAVPARAGGRSPAAITLAGVAVVVIGLALGATLVFAARSRGGNSPIPTAAAATVANLSSHTPAAPTASPGGALSFSTLVAAPSRAATPERAAATPPIAPPLVTPKATAIAAFSGFAVQNADAWGAGNGQLNGCFHFANGTPGSLIRLRITPAQDSNSPVQDSQMSLPSSQGDLCIVAQAQGAAAPGNYVARLFDAAWNPVIGADTAFVVNPRATVTTAPAAPPQPPAPPAALLVQGPDLSAPLSGARGESAPKILRVSALGPARAGTAFQFEVVANNLGADSADGSISVSTPNQPALVAAIGDCQSGALAHTYPPGTRVSHFSGNRADPLGITSNDPLVEAEALYGWSGGASCTLVVTVPRLSGTQATFYLRMTLKAGTNGVMLSTWPVSSSFADQQGLPVLRWIVPISQ